MQFYIFFPTAQRTWGPQKNCLEGHMWPAGPWAAGNVLSGLSLEKVAHPWYNPFAEMVYCSILSSYLNLIFYVILPNFC